MSSRENRWPLALMGLCVVAGVAIAFALMPSEPALEPAYLPADTIKVEVVPQDVLDRMAAANSLNDRLTIQRDKLTIENGQLIDKNGRLIRVVDFLRVRTTPGPPPEPEIVERIIREACGDEDLNLIYRAEMEAYKYRGLDSEGELGWGWEGLLYCEMSKGPPAQPYWTVLAMEPFKLENTTALTSVKPEPVRRPSRYYLGLQYGLLLNGTSFTSREDYSQTVTTYIDPDRFRIYGGRTLWPKKRFPIGVGIFADSSSAGLDLRVSW